MSDSNKCGAQNRTGKPCGHPAGYGTDHPGYGRCKFHMGSTPAVAKSAFQEMAAELIEQRYGKSVPIDPHQALSEEIARTHGHVLWLQEHISNMESDYGLTQYVGEQGTKPSVWIEMYQKERTHLVNVCRIAIGAGLAQRQIELAEQQGAILAGAIRSILDKLKLNDQQQKLVPTVVRSVLSEIPVRTMNELPAA